MARLAVGLDFGHSGIKLVEARRRGKQPVIARAMYLPLPSGAIAGGVIKNSEALEAALTGVAPALRMDRALVVVGIAGAQVHVRPVQVPAVPPAEMYPLVMQEFAAALRLTPEDEDQYYVDYTMLPAGAVTERDVLAVGLRRLDAIAYADVLRAVRLPAYVLDVQAFALPRILPQEEQGCYIDVGAEQTQVLVTSNGEYALYRLLPVGMRRLREELAKAYNTTLDEVQAMQAEKHIDRLLIEAPGLRAPIQAVLDELVGGIIQTLEFLRARHRAVSVGELLPHAFLTGGGALQKGLELLLSEEIGIDVTVGRIFAN